MRSVHPRGCGERTPLSAFIGVPPGSSPRVRGTDCVVSSPPYWGRFIPAGAGNGRRIRSSMRSISVHPRGCGEREYFSELEQAGYGSSPRVRGTGPGSIRASALRRFIPAGAGNGRPVAYRHAHPPVHPRGCGERAVVAAVVLDPFGSSPRVRGTGADRRRPRAAARFIPAGAGNGVRLFPILPTRSVHPRGCGERPAFALASSARAGSSPRVRGTVSREE